MTDRDLSRACLLQALTPISLPWGTVGSSPSTPAFRKYFRVIGVADHPCPLGLRIPRLRFSSWGNAIWGYTGGVLLKVRQVTRSAKDGTNKRHHRDHILRFMSGPVESFDRNIPLSTHFPTYQI